MTKPGQNLFDYIANDKFNPETFKYSLQSIANLEINARDGTNKNTLLGAAVRQLNIEAVKVLLKDLNADPNVLTSGEGHQIWTPVYWTVYNSDKSNTVDAAKRLQIFDLLREAGANLEPLIKTPDLHVSCKALATYATGTMLEDFLLHGISPKIFQSQNAEPLHISTHIGEVLDTIKSRIAAKPNEYLYITALDSEIKLKLPFEAKIKALEALKNGASPQIAATCTKYALELLNGIAQELIRNPDLFLKISLHTDSKLIVQERLIDMQNSWEEIEAISYYNLTRKAVEIEGAADQFNTDAAAEAVTKIATDLKEDAKLLLYYTLHKNTTTQVKQKLGELQTSFPDIGNKAQQALAQGAPPKEEGSEEYTKNALLALQNIAKEILKTPVKLLYVVLHQDSKSKIEELLGESESSISAIEQCALYDIQKGHSIIYKEQSITPNALEAVKKLAIKLKYDPKLWLHITLNDNVIPHLSTALESESSSLDEITQNAVNALKNNENPQSDGSWTPNALSALAMLQEEISKNHIMWLYMGLHENSSAHLICHIKLDIDQVKSDVRDYLERGGELQNPESLTTHTVALIFDIAQDYASKGVPENAGFSPKVIELLSQDLRRNNREDLVSKLHTTLSTHQIAKELAEAVELCPQYKPDDQDKSTTTKDATTKVGSGVKESSTPALSSSGWWPFWNSKADDTKPGNITQPGDQDLCDQAFIELCGKTE